MASADRIDSSPDSTIRETSASNELRTDLSSVSQTLASASSAFAAAAASASIVDAVTSNG